MTTVIPILFSAGGGHMCQMHYGGQCGSKKLLLPMSDVGLCVCEYYSHHSIVVDTDCI